MAVGVGLWKLCEDGLVRKRLREATAASSEAISEPGDPADRYVGLEGRLQDPISESKYSLYGFHQRH